MDMSQEELISLLQDDEVLSLMDDPVVAGRYESTSDSESATTPPVSKRSHIKLEATRSKKPAPRKKRTFPTEQAPPDSPEDDDDEEDPEVKRQKQLLRNRASAAMSRQRKKAQQGQLADQMAFLIAQNEKLTKQLANFQATNQGLTAENNTLRQQLAAVCAQMAPPMQEICAVQPSSDSLSTGSDSLVDPSHVPLVAAQPWPQDQPSPAHNASAAVIPGQPHYDPESAVLGSHYDSQQQEFCRLPLVSLLQCLLFTQLWIMHTWALAEGMLTATVLTALSAPKTAGLRSQ